MQTRSKQLGFTLIELMVAVGVIAVLSALALPMYNGYIQTSRVGALVNNIATIEVFEEDYRLRTGTYMAGVYNGAADANLQTLGWTPQDNDGTVYTITVTSATTYRVNATDTAGTTVCRDYPAKTAC
ncbi:MAG TPA: type IV pilin protein [Candidatus Acidoferrales bacterium]|nr:type IV pilin protein [Candidatus Acidoferrales bacterium]